MEELFDFAFWGKDFSKRVVNDLALKAIKENWGANNYILKNYLEYYFKRIQEQDKIFYNESITEACFNTGLMTELYKDIYAYFKLNRNNSKQKWFFVGFFTENASEMNSFDPLPNIATFYNSPADLFFDNTLNIRINTEHIIKDNLTRFPENIRGKEMTEIATLLEGAVKIAKKKSLRNYRAAVPQYFNGRIQFLLPLYFVGRKGKPELVLTLEKSSNFYIATSCLTFEMAYGNARLIVKPESDWLTLD